MAARRYNSNKIRYELIPHEFEKELAKVFTMGAEKYTLRNEDGSIKEDGSHNWRDGLSWKSTLASIRRHLAYFDKGEDYDNDWPSELLEKYGPTYHLANAAWGLAVLLTYYKEHPELDDRQHRYLKPPKIGLDIDNVIADWTGAWGEKHNIDKTPASWKYHYNNREWLTPNKELDNWYKTIPPAVDPNDLPFEPHAYITARSVDESVTKQWLQDHKFPTATVHTVKFGESKVDVAKKAGIEWFIDDSYENFVELNNAGICTFLWDSPHNKRYDVGYRRIKSFKDFKERFL